MIPCLIHMGSNCACCYTENEMSNAWPNVLRPEAEVEITSLQPINSEEANIGLDTTFQAPNPGMEMAYFNFAGGIPVIATINNIYIGLNVEQQEQPIEEPETMNYIGSYYIGPGNILTPALPSPYLVQKVETMFQNLFGMPTPVSDYLLGRLKNEMYKIVMTNQLTDEQFFNRPHRTRLTPNYLLDVMSQCPTADDVMQELFNDVGGENIIAFVVAVPDANIAL